MMDEKGKDGLEVKTVAGEVDLFDRPTVHHLQVSMEFLEEIDDAELLEEIDDAPASVDISLDSFVALPSSSPPPPPLPPGAGIPSAHGWIKDEGEIARGGMGSIHRVRHQTLRRLAVMKVLEPAKARTLTAQRRFIEEAQITGQLDHPNIPPVHDLWLGEDGTLRFAMKLVEGRTLSDVLRETPPRRRDDQAWEHLLEIFLKVCDAVAFAHSRGVVHRDIKPENIMVGSHGQVWVMDWGLSGILRESQGKEGCVTVDRDIVADPIDLPDTILGTPAYMSPEQAWGRIHEIDERTDVYLLGGVLFAMIAHRPPRRGETMAKTVLRAQRGEIDEISKAAMAFVPPELHRIAFRALRPKREDRYASVDTLRQEITWALRRGLWFRTVILSEGTLVVREGDPADSAYTIIKGTCEVFRTEKGQRVFLRRLGPGETFGETAIFTQKVRTASIEVVDGEMVATVISRDAFDRALRDSWLRPFVLALATRFAELDDQAMARRVRATSELEVE